MIGLQENATPQMRSPLSFMGSIGLHAFVLAWVALVPPMPLPSAALHQREFQPHEQIVWYKLSERLPNVTPPQAKRDARPLRARAKFDQNMVAGAHDTDRPPQLIQAPAPEIHPAKALPLPNIVAVSQPLRPPPLAFTPPPVKPSEPPRSPSLPEAPKIASAMPDIKAPALDVKALPARPIRAFTPPKAPKLPLPSDPPPALPAAPEVATANTVNGSAVPRAHAPFVAPPKTETSPTEAAAVDIGAAPPALTSRTAISAENSLVIAGLDPAKSVEVPTPPGSMNAGFSGGPKPNPKGGEGTPSGAFLEIPSLTIQGGAKNPQPPLMMARLSPTSQEALVAAYRAAHGQTPAAPENSGAKPLGATANLPDPRFYGRQVYNMAIQIPNLTSYSGSWMVWFATHEPDVNNPTVDMRPPLPLHMVSPEYIHSAIEEHVQGKVRLWAVIRKDGHVDEIALLQHLDNRLDRSAEQALSKWLFQPAVRNGATIDVDAVFEIPFSLAPPPPAR